MKYRVEVATDATFSPSAVIDTARWTRRRTPRRGDLPQPQVLVARPGDRLRQQRPDVVDAGDDLHRTTPPITLVSPVNNVNAAGTTAFRWQAQAYAKGYNVEVYKNDDTNLLDGQPRGLREQPLKTSAYVADIFAAVVRHGLPLAGASATPRTTRGLDHWSLLRESTAPTLLSPAPGPSSRPTGPCWSGSRWRARQLPGERDVRRPAATSHPSRPPRPRRPSPVPPPTGTYTWEVTALDRDRKPIGTASSTFTVAADIKMVRAVGSRHPAAPGSGPRSPARPPSSIRATPR